MRSVACSAAAADNRVLKHFPKESPLARSAPWPDKIIALLRARNPAAAIAQIRAASVRDLRALEKALAAVQLAGWWKLDAMARQPQFRECRARSVRNITRPVIGNSPSAAKSAQASDGMLKGRLGGITTRRADSKPVAAA
ncbi:hypothetical protein GCM10028796_18600 [Ramlibacter monticola]